MMSSEARSFETEVALVVVSAMQIGIAVWDDATVKAMSHHARAEFMANITRPFAEQILDLVAQKYDTKSSS